MRNRRRSGTVFCTFLTICLPALAQNSEPFFSYIINVIVEAEGGGGVAAPPARPSVPVRGRRPELMTSSDYSAFAVDCYSTNGDIPSFANSLYLDTYEVNSCKTASSFNLPLTLSTLQLGASVASVIAGSGTNLSLSMKASPPSAGDITAGSGELNYAQIFVAPAGSTVNLPMSATVLGDASAYVVASSDSDCETTNCTAYVDTSGAGAYPSLNLGPFTVGPSGRYTLTAMLSAGVESPGGLPANSIVSLNFCPMNVQLFGNGLPQLVGYATPPGRSLADAATACNFQGFNFTQTITSLPCPNGDDAVGNGLPVANSCAVNTGLPGTVVGPLPVGFGPAIAPPISDPPENGWTYFQVLSADPSKGGTFVRYWNPYPFYWEPIYAETRSLNLPYFPMGGGVPINLDDEQLLWADTPSDPCLPTEQTIGTPLSSQVAAKLQTNRDNFCAGITAAAGSVLAFTTDLVGILGPTSPSPPLFEWKWTSTYNGTVGGTANLQAFDGPDPNTGVGYVTITEINGVPVPPIIPPSQVSTKASGLAYSRVTKTFNGTVTITNTGGATLTTPTSFQLVLNSLPNGVTVANSMGTFNQCPYITIPAITSLAAGQSVTVAVQFSNPSNAIINFTPEFYAGSFQ